MNRQAAVGLFTIVALLGLFEIFFVLGNYGTQGRYKIGVHFTSAAGLHKGALVYESGVIVGVVDQTQLIPDDFTVEVILAINNSVDIPRNARFLIQAPLTGDATLEIVPPVTRAHAAGYVAPTNAPAAIAVLPHEVLPLPEQPQGTNPATIQDLLEQGQGEIRRLDGMLADLQRREPAMLNTLQSALNNANDITVTANAQVQQLSRKLDSMAETLQVALQQSSANVNDMTSQLDLTTRRNASKIDNLMTSLVASAHSLNATATSIQGLAGDPRLHDDILRTTKGLGDTAQTIAGIASDLRNVTGNTQTQAQLRDTVANVDAATQKLNGILASLGGTSSVYGVDRGATPAPAGSVPPGTQPPAGTGNPKPGNVPANVKNKIGSLVKDLVALQIRISELSPQRPGTNSSPLLTRDRGPQTDVNAILLPKGPTYLYTGANDIGSGRTSYNFAAMATVKPGFQIGGGVLYSRLGVRARYQPDAKGFGLDGRLYDLRHPTADGYLNLGLGNGLTLFGGERDITHSGRRTVFGLQLQY